MHRRHFLAMSGALSTTLAATGATAAPVPRDGMDDAATDALASRRYAAERKFRDSRFGRIAYIDRGTGPVALFIHGLPLNSFQWRGAIDRLASQRRCLAPDLLGTGRTEIAAGQGVAPQDQVDMLIAFVDELGVGRFDLVGSDSGGAVAQLIVAQHPDRVRTLLLTNCDVETDSPPPVILPQIEMAKAGTFVDTVVVPIYLDKVLCRGPEGLGGACYSNPAHPTDAAIEEYLAPLVSSPDRKAQLNAYMVALEANPLAGVAPTLRRWTGAAAVVWGMSDTIFSPRDPDYLAGVFSDFRGVRRIPEGKLFFPEEYPDVIAEEARKLWA